MNKVIASSAGLERASETKLRIDRASAGESVLPLSSAQSGIWFAQQIDPSGATFNIGEYVEIDGHIDALLFERALQRIVAESESLRAGIVEQAGEVAQVISNPSAFSVPVIDVSAEPDPRAAAERWMKSDLARPFDLTSGPLFGFALFKASPSRYFWYARYHHIVMDGFSMWLVAGRVAEAYSQLFHERTTSEGSFGPLAALVEQDAAYRASEQCEQDRQYWAGYLADPPEPITLAKRQLSGGNGFLRRTVYLQPSDVGRLRALAQRTRTKLSRVITAGTAIFLHRLTGARDVVFGFPVAARDPVSRRVPGMTSNILPLRFTLHPAMTVSEVIGQSAAQIGRALEHQFYQLADIRRDCGAAADRGAVFRHSLNILPFNYDLSFAGNGGTSHNLSLGPVEELSIEVYERADGSVRIDFDANPAWHTETDLAEHQERFLRLLAAITDVEGPIGRLDILGEAERDTLLRGWNDTAHAFPSTTLPALFAAQAQRKPDAVAVEFEDASLTYAELDWRSNRLAHHLRGLGVGPEVVVGLCLERSLDMVVGLLAILKAGGAYLPLDPQYPAERLAFMLGDAGATRLITHSALVGRLPDNVVARIFVDADAPEISRRPATAPALTLDPHNLAYVIYTSGSTGVPKGVSLCHRNVVAFLDWARDVFGAEDVTSIVASTSICFDLSVFELFAALCFGKKVALALDALHLPKAMAQGTLLNTVPSAVAELVRTQAIPAAVEIINVAGEPLSPDLVRQVYRTTQVRRVYNLYGPSEDTTYSTYAHIPVGADNVPIGRPIWNTRTYVLDASLSPVPVGVAGELYICLLYTSRCV